MNESLTTKKRRTQLNEAHQRGSNCPVFSKLDFSSSFLLGLVYNQVTTIMTAKTRFVLPLQQLQLLQLPHRLQQLRCKPQVKLLMMGPSGWPELFQKPFLYSAFVKISKFSAEFICNSFRWEWEDVNTKRNDNDTGEHELALLSTASKSKVIPTMINLYPSG